MYVIKVVQVLMLFILVRYGAKSKITDEQYRLMPKLFHMDGFDTCMGLGGKALYCTVTIQLGPADQRNKSEVWNIIQDAISDPKNYRHDQLRHGICIPESCPDINATLKDKGALKSEIASCYSLKYENLGLKAVVSEMHCKTDQPSYPIDYYDIAVAIALGVLILVVIFASFYEGCARYKSKEEYARITRTKAGRIISCFSIPKNWNYLTSNNTHPDIESLKCLNGMRFYNLLMVVLVHAALCTIASSIDNPTFAENLTRKPENIILVNGLAAIQTFMIISGFLISYNLLLAIGKGKKFHVQYIILAFVNRYIRLTPCSLVMIALHGTWLYRIGDGPMWDKALGAEYRNCRKNWWTNLVYINNYYDAEHMCMQQAWYLATDTQLFLVALVVVGFMWKYQKNVKFILGLAIIVGFAVPSIINYYNDYDIVIRMYPEALYSIFLKVPHWHAMYSSSIVNFGGYALGLTCGYVFYKRRNKKIFTTKIRVATWWVLSWGLPLSVVTYGIIIYQDNYHYTRIGAAVYAALYRFMFAIGICLMIYGTAEGIGWFYRDCLVWSPLQILSKLTYCIYLVHVPIIRIRGGQARFPNYITYYTMFTQTSGDMVLSLIFSTLLALFVELPVSSLQKAMIPQLRRQEDSDGVEQQINNTEKGEKNEYSHHL